MFLTSRGIRRRLADTYQSQKRFNDARAVNIHGGYTAIMVNEIPVVVDDDCPQGLGIRARTRTLSRGSSRPVRAGWSQRTGPSGSSCRQRTAGTYDAIWLAWFRWYCGFACIRPNRNGMIYGAADDNAA